MYLSISRNFARKITKAIHKDLPKLTPKTPEFPSDFKRMGLKKNAVDPEVISIYNRMKSRGADKLADKVVDKKFIKNESDDEGIFSNLFKDGFNDKPTSDSKPYDSLFPGEMISEDSATAAIDIPEEAKPKLNAELQQFVKSI